MKKLIVGLFFLYSSLVQAAPFVTTFVNTTNINMSLQLHFSDNSIATKGIAMSQSYQAVNFDNKKIVSVLFSSPDKDKNGNLYGQLDKKITKPVADATYNIALKDVPAHEVPAGVGTDAFQMPDSQVIICDLATKDKLPAEKFASKEKMVSTEKMTFVEKAGLQEKNSQSEKIVSDLKNVKEVALAPVAIVAPVIINKA